MKRIRLKDLPAHLRAQFDLPENQTVEAEGCRKREMVHTAEWNCGCCGAVYLTKPKGNERLGKCCQGANLVKRFPWHLATVLVKMGIPVPQVEYEFHKSRRWRFDWAWPDRRLAAEISGGGWSGGHRRGHQYVDELRKYSEAALAGWRVLHFDPSWIGKGTFLSYLQREFAAT